MMFDQQWEKNNKYRQQTKAIKQLIIILKLLEKPHPRISETT